MKIDYVEFDDEFTTKDVIKFSVALLVWCITYPAIPLLIIATVIKDSIIHQHQLRKGLI